VGLRADGIVGPRTRRALEGASAPVLGYGSGYDKPGGSPAVRKLQRRLRSLGHRPGRIDGLYGPQTAEAVARFQRARGLAADGVAWPRTRRAIMRTGHGEPTRARKVARNEARRIASSHTAAQSKESNPRRRRPVANSHPRVPDNGAQEQEAEAKGPALHWLLAGGLLAFTLVAFAYPVVERLAENAPESTTTSFGDRPERSPVVQGKTAIAGKLETANQSERAGATSHDADGSGVQALGYVSVADAGAPAGADLREQIAEMDALCEQRGWRLVEVARDAGVQRHGLFYALERLDGNEASCLIVAELRRLTDSGTELARILTWLREHDVRLVAVDVDLDTATPDGRIAADALISVGEMDHQSPPGRPAVRDLPALKRHIVAMRAAGMTLKAIADRLNDEGVPTLRGGRQWRPSSVQVAAGYRRPGQSPAPRGHVWRNDYARGEKR
jgi:peptidoglycan hydrolase-like protein with peptidoglycan-binding domain